MVEALAGMHEILDAKQMNVMKALVGKEYRMLGEESLRKVKYESLVDMETL